MDEKAFVLIACVNDEELWAECEKYIEELVIPEG